MDSIHEFQNSRFRMQIYSELFLLLLLIHLIIIFMDFMYNTCNRFKPRTHVDSINCSQRNYSLFKILIFLFISAPFIHFLDLYPFNYFGRTNNRGSIFVDKIYILIILCIYFKPVLQHHPSVDISSGHF